MRQFDFQPRTRVVFGTGALARLGELAAGLGFRRALLVADRGLVGAGHVARATGLLESAGIAVVHFHEFTVNPDTSVIEGGRAFATGQQVDSIIGLGGGSSMDCAKGINFLLTNGGRMQDYWGYGKATRPMLPMMGVPTTAGTGSEAQSYALISDATTKIKMACGDPKASFRIAILDPELLVSQPAGVRAATGYDALSHAVETYVTTRRNAVSDAFAREAWRLLEGNYEIATQRPDDLEAQGAMQLGAHFGGAAIENSMLGATHACANPLTARYGTLHGVAIALLLLHVVRWNSSGWASSDGTREEILSRYAQLAHLAGLAGAAASAGETLARRLAEMAAAGGLPARLQSADVIRSDIPALADAAAEQWTGTFNPRPFDAAGAREIYECAW